MLNTFPRRPIYQFVAILLVAMTSTAHAQRGGELRLSVIDQANATPLAARMHLKNAAGRMPRVQKLPVWHDHFVFDGEITLKLPKGIYKFELECGPEFLDQQGHFEIADFADDEKTIEMKRFVNMADYGWYSGDLDVQRPVKDIELLMKADDLHVAHLFAAKGKPMKGDVPAEGVLFDADRYYRVIDNESELSDVKLATQWDLPVLVSEDKVDCVELASARLGRNKIDGDERGLHPRDRTLFPGADGIARWNERVYYHLLNCGLRIPPSAGSGSGDAPNPVGYNRVYVHLDGGFTYEQWLDNLKAGRLVVTNGPMMRPTVEGEYPGHVFRADAGEVVELEVGLNLATREKIDYLEVIQNGNSINQVRLAEFKKSGGHLPKVIFKESGWFLLRAVTNNQNTYRFAMSAPYYVEIGYDKRISKSSVQFFLDWLGKMPGEKNEAAVEWWTKLLGKANVE